MREAPDCRPAMTTWHALQPRTSTSHPPQQQDTVYRSCFQARGRGPVQAQDRCAAPHGRLRAPPPPTSAPSAAPHNTSPANNNRPEERRISCRQQQAPPQRNATKMSPRISISPEPVLAADAPSQLPTAPPQRASCHVPHTLQLDGGKTDVLSSANGPSTAALQKRSCHCTSALALSPS
jgi:hypothetical protein